MQTHSAILLVLDDTGTWGPNGLQYGVKANCRRFMFEIQATHEDQARAICEAIGLIYDGRILATYDVDTLEGEEWKNG